jgi:exopolyphosphatase / guanosine-5'-triphosphate,3'-diphosphate pyrophosphatase
MMRSAYRLTRERVSASTGLALVSNVRTNQDNQLETIAAFDIGSNTIKMTVGRHRESDGLDEIMWRAETVRLGQGIDETGRLAEDRMNAAAETIARFAEEARKQGASRLIGVATEATRFAANGEAFLDRIRDETGLELATISGDREAELTFRGLSATTDISGSLLVADIGGASTELITAEGEKVETSRSIPLGSGRLSDRHVNHDPPAKSELDACRSEAIEMLRPFQRDFGKRERLIAVGGTGEYLMPLIPHGGPASIEDVDHALDFLQTVPAAELVERLAIPLARAKVLPAGVAVVRALADLTQPTTIEGARSGIRTGLLLAAFAGEI